MLIRMKIHIVCFSILLLAAGAFAQIPHERQILVTPNAEHPQAAKDSGLGGPVRVAVTVDQAGNVIAVGEATGPGNVCPSVTRTDVVALREASRTAAANAKFVPSEQAGTSSTYLTFTFPLSSGRRFEVTGELEEAGSKSSSAPDTGFTIKPREYTAANEPPAEYLGPRITGSATSSDGKAISGGVLNGKARSLPKPPYPPAARAVRASGAVPVQVLIYEDGNVFSAAAVSGHPLLRAAARNAACGAVFSPTYLEGIPVKVSGVVTYNFVP